MMSFDSMLHTLNTEGVVHLRGYLDPVEVESGLTALKIATPSFISPFQTLPIPIGDHGVARMFDESTYRFLKDLGCPDPRLFGTALIPKPPGEARRMYHQDWWGWDFPETSTTELSPQIGMLYFFSEAMSELDGVTVYVPGSALSWTEGLDGHLGDSAYCVKEHPREKKILVRPGDMVLLDARTLHASSSNYSANIRYLATVWITTNYSALPPDCMTQASRGVDAVTATMIHEGLVPDLSKAEYRDGIPFANNRHPPRELKTRLPL